MRNLDSWLAQHDEDILEPDRLICDPHHHLWDRAESTYMLDELWRDTGSGHRVAKTVFIECASGYREDGPEALRPVGETEFVLPVALESRRDSEQAEIAGIVGFADLLSGDAVAGVLEAHLEAGQGLFRGIRHAGGWHASDDIRNSHSEPPEGLYADSTFRRGFARLAPLGLTFEAWQYHTQLGDVLELARAFPETTIILDHLGGPLGIGPYVGRLDEVFAAWKPAIAEVATCHNVVVKLGGIQMPINGFGFHKRDRPPSSEELEEVVGRYYRHGIDCFGPERGMFESNFPVDRQSCSYRVLWNLFKRLAKAFSEDEKHALFYGTAVRVYRLAA